MTGGSNTGLQAAISAISHTPRFTNAPFPPISSFSYSNAPPVSAVNFTSFSQNLNSDMDEFSCNFEWLEVLGTGSFGIVQRVRDSNGQFFAVKKSLRAFSSEKYRTKLIHEMELVNVIIPHPNIVLHYRAWQEGGHSFLKLGLNFVLCIFYPELCERGNLYSLLKSPETVRDESFFLKFLCISNIYIYF